MRPVSRTIGGVRFVSDGGRWWHTADSRYLVAYREAGLSECQSPHPMRAGFYCEGGAPHPFYAWMVWDRTTRDYAFDIRDARTFRVAAEDLASRLEPDSVRSAPRGAGMMRVRVGVSGGITVEPESVPDSAPREGDIWADPNRLLYTEEVCALLNPPMTPDTWRSVVRRGSAPKPDDPDLGTPVNRRRPRWKLSTVVRYQHERKPRRRKRREEE